MARSGHGRAATRANNALFDLITHKYFSAIPLDRIYDIVEAAGFTFEAEEKQCMLCGRDGRATWELFAPNGHAVNHMLVVEWHKMERSGRYEVNAYVS